MNEKVLDAFSKMFDFDTTANLLTYDFVQQALIAAAILGLLAGALGPLIVSRQWAFAVHGSSELSLTGASAALLVGITVGLGAIVGSVVAAVMFALLGTKARDRDSVIGVIMSFGLGLSVLFIWLYPGRTGTSFSLLIGQIVGVSFHALNLNHSRSARIVCTKKPSRFHETACFLVPPHLWWGGGPRRICGVVVGYLAF